MCTVLMAAKMITEKDAGPETRAANIFVQPWLPETLSPDALYTSQNQN